MKLTYLFFIDDPLLNIYCLDPAAHQLDFFVFRPTFPNNNVGRWTIIAAFPPYDGVRTVITMSFFINITNFVVDSLSNNANINYGPTYQNSHTANSILIGSNINIGDNGSIVSKNIIKGDNNKLFKNSDSNSSS